MGRKSEAQQVEAEGLLPKLEQAGRLARDHDALRAAAVTVDQHRNKKRYSVKFVRVPMLCNVGVAEGLVKKIDALLKESADECGIQAGQLVAQAVSRSVPALGHDTPDDAPDSLGTDPI